MHITTVTKDEPKVSAEMPALLERPKMTRAMYEALKRHIMREREKKKRAEQEQDEMMERLERERELRKKKEEEDSLTLEQTKEQIIALEKKVEMLKAQKHELFSQLKKVLEVETRRRKEQNEMTMSQPTYQHPTLPPTQQPMMMHGRPTLYKPPAPAQMMPVIKRQRSPTPPPPSSSASNYQGYPHSGETKFSHPPSDNKYGHSEAKYSSHGESKFVHSDPKYLPASFGAKSGGPPSHLFAPQHSQANDYKSSNYQPPGASHLYAANQPFQQQAAASSYASSSQASSSASKYQGPPSQSAFSSYQGHYAQSHPQKALNEQFPAAYPIQRMQQPGYHPALTLQQSMDHAGQKQGAFEDKYKMGQNQIRVMVPTQQPTLISQALQLQQQQQQQSKNASAFVGGYPRNKAGPPGANYPTSTSASTYSSQAGPQARAGYSSQSHGRYY